MKNKLLLWKGKEMDKVAEFLSGKIVKVHKNELVSFLRSNYIDLETVITYCENVTNDFKNSMHKIDNSFIKDRDAQKKFFDRGYVKIVDVKNDLEESRKVEESVGVYESNFRKLEYIKGMLEVLDMHIEHHGNDADKMLCSYVDKLYTIMDAFNSYAKRHPFAEDMNEATSGIGGAYTTKAIDMVPTGTKVKKIQEIAKANIAELKDKINKETSK